MKHVNCYKKTLIVEDNEINMKVATLLLGECGIKNIVTARTGKEALEKYSPDIDLVFLDIGLPDISGLEVCHSIRSQNQQKQPIIIACTADNSLEHRYKKIGIDEYLLKPITIAQLKNVVKLYASI